MEIVNSYLINPVFDLEGNLVGTISKFRDRSDSEARTIVPDFIFKENKSETYNLSIQEDNDILEKFLLFDILLA